MTRPRAVYWTTKHELCCGHIYANGVKHMTFPQHVLEHWRLNRHDRSVWCKDCDMRQYVSKSTLIKHVPCRAQMELPL